MPKQKVVDIVEMAGEAVGFQKGETISSLTIAEKAKSFAILCYALDLDVFARAFEQIEKDLKDLSA